MRYVLMTLNYNIDEVSRSVRNRISYVIEMIQVRIYALLIVVTSSKSYILGIHLRSLAHTSMVVCAVPCVNVQTTTKQA